MNKQELEEKIEKLDERLGEKIADLEEKNEKFFGQDGHFIDDKGEFVSHIVGELDKLLKFLGIEHYKEVTKKEGYRKISKKK